MKTAISIPDELGIIGGMVWEGVEEDASPEEALQDLGAGIAARLEDMG